MSNQNALWDNDRVSDIESQYSSLSDSTVSRKSSKRWNRETGSGHRRIPVGMNFSDEVVKQVRKDYGIDPLIAPSQEYHDHPHLALQRNLLEVRAMKEIKHTRGDVLIWDVGSGARRHAKHRIHCLCPYLQPGDDLRLNLASRNGNTVCAHRLQDCTCGVPDVLLFVHSAYYFGVNEMISQIKRSTFKEAYVVGHLFKDAFGSFAYGEGDYYFDLSSKEDWVVTKVKGNAHTYQHPPLPWDGYMGANDEGETLGVEQVARMGDTYLWRVVVTPHVPPPSTLDWRSAVVDVDHMGPIHVPGYDAITKQCLAANDRVEVQVDHLIGRYGYLFTYTRNGRIYIPRGVIEDVATELVRKVRDPALMADVVYKMKAAVKKSRLPAGARLDAVTIGSALAFNINVQNEVDTGHTIASRYSYLWRLHERVHSLVPVKATSLMCLGLYLFLLICWSTLVGVFDVEVAWSGKVKAIVSAALIAPPFVILLLVFGSFCLGRYHARRTMDNWSRTLFTESLTSHIVDDAARPLLFNFPANPHLRPPVVPPACGTIEIGPDPRPPKHPGRLRLPLTLDGVGVAEAVPSAPRTDQESEVTAITLRMLTAPTVVVPTAYDKFISMEGDGARSLMNIRCTGYDQMYDEWINQAKFPKAVREKFHRAWDKCNRGESVPPVGMFNAFVKFEKMKAMTMEAMEGLKTRLINGPPDAVKVAVGPWTAQLYNRLVHVWDGVQSKICYASGKTPDHIGRVIDQFVESCGGFQNVIGVWDDCTAYDSTLENELLALRDVVYPRVGFPAQTMAWLHSVSPKGVTPHGVKYDLGKKMIRVPWSGEQVEVPMEKLRSGEMDTNLIGTIVNAIAHESGLPADDKWLMLVCGDDNLLLYYRAHFKKSIADDLLEHLRDLGLQPTQGISEDRADWEFCSKLLWEGWDPQLRRVQTVLGPKPARWLHRVGWALNGPNEPNFREVMLSSYQDVNHIPLLGAYVYRGLQVSSTMRRTGRVWSEMKHVSKKFDCTEHNYSMLEKRYGVTREHVEEFHIKVSQIMEPRTVISLPWIISAVKRDEE
jgi:hypothetical protein